MGVDAERNPVFILPHSVRSAETDLRGRLSLRALCELLQESGGRHAASLGVGAADLGPMGLAWVLIQWSVRIEACPAGHAALTVETWPSGLTERTATRDFLLRDAGGGLLARATSHWVMLDLQRRRPVRMPDVVRRIPLAPRPRALDEGLLRLPAPGPSAEAAEFTVRWSDLDANGHVNNLAYVEWTVESVPREMLRSSGFRRFDISFRAETGDGATVRVVREQERQNPPDETVTLRHRIVETANGRELALARTTLSPDENVPLVTE
ncbi:MAG: acyl-[acyl-carrier-protein] thioesterase [Acidithiobacillales bacterium]